MRDLDAAPVEQVDEDAATIERQPAPAPTPSMIVERPRSMTGVSGTTRPSSSSAWVGWAVAGVLLVLGIAFYAGSYAPLRGELSDLEQRTAAQLKERDDLVRSMRVRLDEMQRSLAERAASAAAAPTVAPAPTVAEQHAQQQAAARARPIIEQPRAETAPAEPKVAEPKLTEPKASEPRTEQPTAKAKAGFDRAAAAAATAALEAQEYGSSPKADKAPAPAASEAPKPSETPKASEPAATAATKKEPPSRPATDEAPTTPEKKDSLSDIEKGPSDDPLEGL
jgi:translation initiation factor IF-2